MFRKFGFRVVEQVLRKIKLSHTPAVCPGSEGAVLKIVGRKRLAGANPVHGVFGMNNSALFHWNTPFDPLG